MNPLAVLPDEVVIALGWTLLHFLWQGTLVAGLLLLLQKAMVRASSNARYLVACGALAVMFVLPLATFTHVRSVVSEASTVREATPAGHVAAAAPAESATREGESDRTSAVLTTGDLDGAALRAVKGRAYVIDDRGELVRLEQTPGGASRSVASGSAARSGASVVIGTGEARVPGAATLAEKPAVSPSFLQRARRAADAVYGVALAAWLVFTTLASVAQHWLVGHLGRAMPWLVGAWAIGVIGLTLRLVGGWIVVQRIRRQVLDAPLDALQTRVDELRERLRVSRPVRIFKSALVEVPTVIGWLRPVVLVPAGALVGMSPRQLEALLAHELAHIRRHDYLVNLFQTIGETILFYHPAVWWVSNSIRAERENACDDVAVAVCGDRVVYARALWELERARAASFELAMAANGASLIDRVRRILAPAPKASHTSRWAAGAVIMGAVLAVLLGMGPLLSDSDELDRSGKSVRRGVFQYASADQTAPRAMRSVAPLAPLALVPRVVAVAPMPRIDMVPVPVPQLAPEAPDDVQVEPFGAPRYTPPAVRAPRVAPDPVAVPTPDARSGAWATRTVRGGVANPWTSFRVSREPAAPRSTTAPTYAADAGVRYSDGWAGATAPDVHEDCDTHADRHAHVHRDVLIDVDALARRVEFQSSRIQASIEELEDLRIDLSDLRDVRVSLGGKENVEVDLATLAEAKGFPVDLDDFDFGGIDLDDEQLQELQFTDVGFEGFDPDERGDIRRMFSYLSRNGVTPRFVAALAQSGMGDVTAAEVVLLQRAGVTPEYVRSLAHVGLDDLEAGELLALQQQHVSAERVRDLTHALEDESLDAGEVIAMQLHGVTPEYVGAMRRSGLEFDADDLLVLRVHGVEPEFVERVVEAGFDDDVDAEDVVLLHRNGMNADWIQGMRGAGYESLELEELDALVRNGVSPEYVRSMRDAGLPKLEPHELLELHRSGVSPEWVSGLAWLGYEVDTRSLVELRSHGISLGFAAQMRQIGYRDLTLDQLRDLKIHGVTPEYVASLRVLGYPDIAAEDVIELRDQGVTPELVAAYNAASGQVLDTNDIVTLQRYGVRAWYLAGMVNAAPAISLNDVVQLQRYGVAPEYIAELAAIEGRGFTLDDVVTLHNHGVRSRFIAGLVELGRADMSIDDVTRLTDQGVSLGFVRKVNEAGYADADAKQIVRWFHRGLPAPRRTS